MILATERTRLGHRLRQIAHPKAARMSGNSNRKTFYPIAACCLAMSFIVGAHIMGVAIADDSLPPVREIYIPSADLDVLLNRDKRGTVLPRKEFEELYARARQAAETAPQLPSGIVVSSVVYRARLVDQQLLVSAEIAFQQFRNELLSLAIPLRGLAVEDAKIGDAPARIGRVDGTGPLQLLHDRAGKQTLKLEMSAPVAVAGGDLIAAFGLIPAGSATLEVTVAAGKQLLVNDRQLERPGPADAETAYRVAVGGQPEVNLRITDGRTARDSDSLVFATTAYSIAAEPGKIGWQASTSLQVFGRTVDRLIFRVPRELEIANVDSSGLDNWELSDDPQDATQTIITLNYRQAIEESRQINFQGVMSTAANEPWSVPNLKLQGASSHIGRLVVRAPLGVRLLLQDSAGARRVLADEPPSAARRTAEAPTDARHTQVFELWREDFDLSFATAEKQTELQAAVSTVVDIREHEAELRSSATLAALFSPLFEVTLTLPSDWSITDITVGGKPANWTLLPQEAGVHIVRVPLEPQLAPGAEVLLSLGARRDIELDDVALDVDLPEVRLPQAGVVEGTFVVRADDVLEVVPTEISGLDPVLLGLEGERLGFRYQDTRFSGRLQVAHQATRLAARTTTYARLDPEALRTINEIRIEAEAGAPRNLEIVVPESAGTDLRFSVVEGGARIVQQTPGTPADGQRTWTLQFDSRWTGTLRLLVSLESPRGDAQEFPIHTIRVPAAERQYGFIAIEAEPDQRLTLSAAGADGLPLEEVDPVDLPSMKYYVPKRIVAAYRYVSPGYRVAVSETRFAREAVPTAVCQSALLESAFSRSGEIQHHAVLNIVAVGVQALEVRLKDGSDLWAAALENEPIEVRRADGKFLIPLPSVEDPEQSRRLELFYSEQGSDLDSSGVLQQQPPHVSAVSGDGVVQPLEVLGQTWTLHYPEHTLLVDSDGRFEPTDKLDTASWLGRLQNSLGEISEGDLLRNALTVLGAAIVIAIVVLMIRSARQVQLTALVAFVCLAGLLLALMLSFEGSSKHASDIFAETAATSRSPSAGTPIQLQDQASNSALPPPAAAPPPPVSEIESQIREPLEQVAPPMAAPEDAAADQNVDMDRQVEPQQQMQQPAVNVPARRSRLSVAMQFQALDGASKEFRYQGATLEESEPALQVRYTNRDSGLTFRLVIAAAIVLIGWIIRDASARWRAVMCVLGIALPLALVTIAPASWQMLLDGMFIGVVATILLWCVRALLPKSSPQPMKVPRFWRRATATTPLLLALITGYGDVASAQEQVKPVIVPSPAPPIVVVPKTTTIYVPFDVGSDPLSASKVFVPQDEFAKLWNLAHPDQPLATPVPAVAVVAAAIYSAELAPISEGIAPRVSVKARFVLHVSAPRASDETNKTAFHTLTLPLEKVALRTSTLDGQPAALTLVDDGKQQAYRVTVAGGGVHILDVEFDVPATLDGPAGQFAIPVKAVAAGRLTFQLPAKELAVRVNDSSTTYRRSAIGDAEQIEVPIDAGGTIIISWQPQTARGATQAVVHADGRMTLLVTPAGTDIRANYEITTRQGTLSELGFTIPASLRLKRISGPDVGGWELNEAEQQRTLKVFFRRAVIDRTQLEFELFLPQTFGESDTALALPAFGPLDLARETGVVGLYAGEEYAVRSIKTNNAAQIDASTFAVEQKGRYSQPPRLAYRYSSRPFELEWTVARRAADAVATAQYGVSVEPRLTRIAARFVANFSAVPRSRVAISLPAEFLVLNVNAAEIADWYTTDVTDGRKQLIIEWGTPRLGEVEIILNGTVAKQPQDATVQVNLPQLLELNRLQSELAIWIDSAYSAFVDNSATWRSINPDRLNEKLRIHRPQAVQFAFQSSERLPNVIQLSLNQAEPRLSADSVTILNLADTSVAYTLALQWRIEAAATDTFVFTTPDWLAGYLNFRADGLRQISQTAIDVGRVRWTVTLQEPVRDRFFLLATATFPPSAADVRTPLPIFEQRVATNDGESFQQLVTQRQFVMLVNQSSAQAVPRNPDALQTVRREDLPIIVDQSLVDQAAVIARASTNTDVLWQLNRLPRTPGAPASVNLADLTTFIERDGTWRTQANYTIRNRTRQFLALTLPADSRLLSVLVKDRPARTMLIERTGVTYHLVPLPKTSEADLSSVISIVIAGRLPQGSLPRDAVVLKREIDIPAPQVISQQDDTEYGIPVARTRWNVYLPDDLMVTPVDDRGRTNMSRATQSDASELERASYISDANELLGVLEGAASSRVKYKALQNLDELQVRVTTPHSGVQSKDGLELSGRFDKAKSRFQIDAGNQMAIDASAPTQNFFDESLQKQRVLDQNRQLFESNTATVRPELSDTKRDEFGFVLSKSLEGRVPLSSDAPAEKTQEEIRGLRRSQSESQLSTINQDFQQKKSEAKERFGKANEFTDNFAIEDARQNFLQQGGRRPVAAGGGGFFGGGGGGSGGGEEWTSAGGLSLRFDVPTTGRQWTFTKVGGSPKLALALRPQESLTAGLGFIWTLAWLAVAAALTLALLRATDFQQVLRYLPLAAVILGLVAFFLLPGVGAWFGFAVAVIGGFILALQYTRPSTAA